MWSDMSANGLLFHWVSTIKIQLRILVLNKADIISSKLNITSSDHDMAEKYHSLTPEKDILKKMNRQGQGFQSVFIIGGTS